MVLGAQQKLSGVVAAITLWPVACPPLRLRGQYSRFCLWGWLGPGAWLKYANFRELPNKSIPTLNL